MTTTLAALDVIEASLDEQLDDWRADEIWRDWVENLKAGIRVDVRGRIAELHRVKIIVPWRRQRQLRLAVERWAARKAIAHLKGTNA